MSRRICEFAFARDDIKTRNGMKRQRLAKSLFD